LRSSRLPRFQIEYNIPLNSSLPLPHSVNPKPLSVSALITSEQHFIVNKAALHFSSFPFISSNTRIFTFNVFERNALFGYPFSNYFETFNDGKTRLQIYLCTTATSRHLDIKRKCTKVDSIFHCIGVNLHRHWRWSRFSLFEHSYQLYSSCNNAKYTVSEA
jgi:hypothetical protein